MQQDHAEAQCKRMSAPTLCSLLSEANSATAVLSCTSSALSFKYPSTRSRRSSLAVGLYRKTCFVLKKKEERESGTRWSPER